MKHLTCICAAFVLASTNAVVAQSLYSTTVEGVYTDFDEDDLDRASTSLFAGFDAGVTPQIAIGGNLAYFDADDAADTVFNATGHVMYTPSPNTAWGLFGSTEEEDDIELTTYGVEFASASDRTRFEGYYGGVESDDLNDIDVTIAGLSFEFQAADSIWIGLDYEAFTQQDILIVTTGGSAFTDDLITSDVALTARYFFAEGASAYVEFGQISQSATNNGNTFESEDDLGYIAVGAEYSFGRQTGTFFSDRTLLGFGEGSILTSEN